MATMRGRRNLVTATVVAALTALSVVLPSQAETYKEAGYPPASGSAASGKPANGPSATPSAHDRKKAAASSAATMGQWTTPFQPNSAAVAVHAILLRTGKVLIMG
ncbi:MAG: hypothetical protein ACREQ5_39250, partial [Candidatus Dormibacteria bacterium]